jgi:hypothetical protein
MNENHKLCALGFAVGLSAFTSETRVKPSDLPAAVQAAMKNQIGGATIVGASKELEHGRMTYEVETKLNGKGRDLTFAENGSLLEVEQEVSLESIPAPAREAIEKRERLVRPLGRWSPLRADLQPATKPM